MDEILSAARLTVALAFMIFASVKDWRTRRVPDRVWVIMGTIGLFLLAMELFTSETELFFGTERTFGMWHFLILIPVGVIFYDTFWDREPIYDEGKVNLSPIMLYAVAVTAVAVMVYREGITMETGMLLAIPAVMCVFIIFYYMGVIRGGADAKALLALAIMFPVYPVIASLPLISYPENAADVLHMTFPFTFLVLMNAAILHAISGPVLRFFKNLARGDRGFPEMLLGYRMDIADVPKNFVWPMEAVRDDEVVLIVFPSRKGDIKDELLKLRAKGLERIWVTPKDPFIIPMTLSIIFSAIIGNLVILFF